MLMKKKIRLLTLSLALVGVSALIGCGNDNGDSGDDDVGDGCTIEANFASIHADLLSTMTCASNICHGPPANQGGLDFTAGAAAVHGMLVGAPSVYTQATHDIRIVAGTSSASWFFVKIADPLAPGGRMPSGGALSQCDIDRIDAWIEAGASM